MQPYFFPYIGYFLLIDAVDKFVFYDDVNFIKSGWINRNRLFLAGAVKYVSVPLSGASSFEKINKTRIQSGDEWVKRLLSSISQYYAKAPFYKPVYDLAQGVLQNHDGYISTVARNSVIATAQYLGLKKDFVFSSAIYANQQKKSVERVLDICRIEHATEYWNLPGGRNLYHLDEFSKEDIELKFVDVSMKPYYQHTPEFQPGLSILDVLMFNDPAIVRKMLQDSHAPNS
jgi:hypothetical protein